MIPTDWLIEARQRVTPHIHQTPLTYDADLNVYLKWENQQVTGSFKVRGAINKVLSLQDWERQRGLVTASAGNHGAGLAYASSKIQEQVQVFVPESTPQIKIDHIREYGGIIHFIPGSYGDAERSAIEYAHQNQASYISPYNDGQIIAGQATVAIEAVDQLKEKALYDWVVPVGGGGLISGIGAVIKSKTFLNHEPTPRLYGVQSEASPFMYNLYKFSNQDDIKELPSMADGLSGEVEPDSITIPIVKQLVDDILLVTEEEIKEAIHYAWIKHHQRIEGSAAVVLAAALFNHTPKRPLILIMSGGNIQPKTHQQIVGEY